MNQNKRGINRIIQLIGLKRCALAILVLMACACSNTGHDNNSSIAFSYKCDGDSCLADNNYVGALDNYIKAVKESFGSEEKDIYAAAICNIGIIYATFNDYDRAAYYFEKGYSTSVDIDNKRVASICATNMLLCAVSKKDSVQIRQWMKNKSLYPLDDTDVDKVWSDYANALIEMGDGNYSDGRKILKNVVDYASSNNLDKEFSVMAYIDIGSSWKKEGQRDSAMYYYYKALGMSDNYINQEKEIYRNLIHLYSDGEEKDSVLKYQTSLLALSDSIYDINKFNFKKNELTTYENEVNELQLKTLKERYLILLCISIPLLVLLIIIIQMNRKLKRTWKMLWDKHNLLILENEESLKWKEKYYSTNNCESSSDSDEIIMSKDQENEGFKMSESMRQHIDMGLIRLLDKHEILLDPDLTINYVASLLKVNSKYISLTISDKYGMNFRSFINQQKLKEVCRRLSDDSTYGKLTIAAIASDCGFRSVNNFTVLFKKYTGMTPLKYRNMSKSK